MKNINIAERHAGKGYNQSEERGDKNLQIRNRKAIIMND